MMDFRVEDPEDFSLEFVLGFSTRTLPALPVLYPDDVRRTNPVAWFFKAVVNGGSSMTLEAELGDRTELMISSAILSRPSVKKYEDGLEFAIRG